MSNKWFVGLGVLLLAGLALSPLRAQPGGAYPGGDPAGGQFPGGEIPSVPVDGPVSGGEPPVFESRLPLPWHGLYWVGANIISDGFGEQNSYFTLGGKRLLCEDWFEGRWALEGRLHLALDSGMPFANVGLERQFYIAPAMTDVNMSVWYDFDSNQDEVFGHSFHQAGLSASLKNPLFDIYWNGYLPMGETNFIESRNCFVGNRIVIPGIDSALQGFDCTARFPIPRWAMIAAKLDLGGYYYRSDLVQPFGGVRGRVSVEAFRGAVAAIELSHDDTYQTTGAFFLAWQFGANGSFSPSGRDLEPTPRRDNVTRFTRSGQVAIDPRTGEPYNVIHVDNSTGGTQQGTFENPFISLAQAEAGSVENDVIFVREGFFAYNESIALKRGQYFLGDGVRHLIPVPGGMFELCNDIDGFRPILQSNGAPIVTLSPGGDNIVRGFNFQGGAQASVFGVGMAGPVLIENNLFNGGPGNAIHLVGGLGPFTIIDNQMNLGGAGANGVLLQGMAAGTLTRIVNNTIAATALDGIRVENTNGRVEIDGNTVSLNIGRDAIQVTGGLGGDFQITENNLSGGRDGVRIVDHRLGVYNIEGNTIFNSSDNGVHLLNSTNAAGTPARIVDNTITGNGAGGADAGVRLVLNDPLLTVTDSLTTLVSGNTIDANGFGVFSQALGEVGVPGDDPTMTTIIRDNISISNNTASGVLGQVGNGATLNLSVIDNLGINRNGLVAGQGVRLLSDGAAADGVSRLNVEIRGNTMNANRGIIGDGTAGIFGSIQNASVLTATITDNLIDGAGFANNGSDDAVRFNFNLVGLAAADINRVTLDDNIIQSHDDNGLTFNFNGDINSRVDVLARRNTISASGDSGVAVTASGLGVGRFRLTDDNFVTASGEAGVDLRSTGTATLIASIDNNAGPGAGIRNNGLLGLPNSGVNAAADDGSVMVLDLLANDITGNNGPGASLALGPGGVNTPRMFAFVRDNVITGNNPGGPDFTATTNAANLVTSQLCLELTNNTSTSGFLLTQPAGSGAVFNFETPAVGNVGAITQVGVITPVGAGACTAAAAPFRAFP